jgi:hypothetical protein
MCPAQAVLLYLLGDWTTALIKRTRAKAIVVTKASYLGSSRHQVRGGLRFITGFVTPLTRLAPILMKRTRPKLCSSPIARTALDTICAVVSMAVQEQRMRTCYPPKGSERENDEEDDDDIYRLR